MASSGEITPPCGVPATAAHRTVDHHTRIQPQAQQLEHPPIRHPRPRPGRAAGRARSRRTNTRHTTCFDEVAAALCAHAAGLLCAMAAVELLIEHAVWLRREDFVDRFVTVQADPARVGETALASVDLQAAADAVEAGRLPCSAGEGRVLLIAASFAEGVPLDLGEAVTGLDAGNAALAARAVLLAAGRGEAADVWRGWRGADLGGDHPSSSSAGGSAAAGAGAHPTPWAAGVASGVAGWQQAVDPAGLDRRRARRRPTSDGVATLGSLEDLLAACALVAGWPRAGRPGRDRLRASHRPRRTSMQPVQLSLIPDRIRDQRRCWPSSCRSTSSPRRSRCWPA